MQHLRSFVLLLSLIAGVTSTAQASLIVSASATGFTGSPFANQSGEFDSSLAHAVVIIRADQASTIYESAGPTGLPLCLPGSGGANNSEIQARGCAEANGNNGQLKTYNRARNGASSEAAAMILDPVFFLVPPVFTIDLDFDASELGGVYAAAFLIEVATGVSDFPWLQLYRYEIRSDGFLDGVSPDAKSALERTDSVIPQITYSSVIDQNFSDTFAPNVFALGDLNSAKTIRVSLRTAAFCNEDANACDTLINALNTAYIGISTPYASQSGYQYLGANAAEVPEPNVRELIAAGLVALLVRGTTRKATLAPRQ